MLLFSLQVFVDRAQNLLYHQRLRATAPIFDNLLGFVAVNPAPSLCVAKRGKVVVLLLQVVTEMEIKNHVTNGYPASVSWPWMHVLAIEAGK